VLISEDIQSPLHTLLTELGTTDAASAAASPAPESRLYLASDPALIILYKLLRGKTTQTLRGFERISPADEFEFVMHTARLYDRMGCDLLALELVKNWEFLEKRLPGDNLRKGVEWGVERTVDGYRGRRNSILTIEDEIDRRGEEREKGKQREKERKGGMGGKIGAVGVGASASAGAGVVPMGTGLGTGKTLVKPPPSVFQEPDMSWAFG